MQALVHHLPRFPRKKEETNGNVMPLKRRQIDRQTEIKLDRPTDRHINRQTDRQKN